MPDERTDAERYAPITIDPYEHARSFRDATEDSVPESAVRAMLTGAASASARNENRLREAARALGHVTGDRASPHAEVDGQLREARRAIEGAAEWYADYYDALATLATERDVSDA